jgi:hypothetical protein
MIDVNGVHRACRYVLTEVSADRLRSARDARDLAVLQVLMAIKERQVGYASDLAEAALTLCSIEIEDDAT